jgi:FKBP-type peptidyl-prolyl cis-trans isomerase FklB
MKTIKNLILPVGAIAALISCGEQKSGGNASLNNNIDSVSYAIGLNIGQNLKTNKAGELNYEAVSRGIQDKVSKDSNFAISETEAMTLMQEYFQNRFKVEADANLEKGLQWLENNKTKEGVIALESGSQYRVIREGNGPIPSDTSRVLAHYTGRLVDGKVFDSSVERGQPLEFRLGEMIPGWKELLTKMPVGSKWELFIPPQLAYGESGTRDGSIPPNAVLIFEVELLEIIED